MISDIEEQNRAELFNLMREYPNLPVVPMVDSEIISDDYCSRYKGVLGAAYIAEYLIGDKQIYFYDDEDEEQISEVLTAFFGYDRWLQMDENGTAAAEYAALPWTRAIIIDIDPF
jgi:hypothetical protein